MDDHSDDETIQVAMSLEIPELRILELKDFDQRECYGKAFKKAGLHFGLREASYSTILTTDADCMVGPQWVETMRNHLAESKGALVTGPIRMTSNGKSIIEEFQQIEMMGTMAGTMAGMATQSYYSANAANMIFYKDDYLGFLAQGATMLASGDDMFFVQYLAQRGDKVSYAKDHKAIVDTPAEGLFSDLFSQRLRWATKTKSYKDMSIKVFMGLIFLFHLSIIGSLFISLIIGSKAMLLLFVIQFIVKVVLDYRLLSRTAIFFDIDVHKARFVPLVMLHTIYVVAMGVCGLLLSQYTWKGRRVS